jgi:hypothetical protein
MKLSNEHEKKAFVLACSWKNSGVVYFLSTSHQGGETKIVHRQSGISTINIVTPIIYFTWIWNYYAS